MDQRSGGELSSNGGKGVSCKGRALAWLAGLSALVAAVASFLTNSTSVLASLRTVHSEFLKTSDQFSAWYHDDKGWTGYWTNEPEAYADLADMGLSRERMSIDITAKNGLIDGTVSTHAICGATPFYDYFLVRGEVSGSKSATVIVWDIFQGHKSDIAKLELERDGVVLTATPVEGGVRLFPQKAKLAIDPNMGTIERGQARAEFCVGKTRAMAEALGRLARDRAKAKPSKQPAH